MKKSIPLIFFVCTAFFATPARDSGAAELYPGTVRLGVGFDFSVGNYSTRLSTEVLHLPVTATYESGPLKLEVSIPFTELSGPGNVVIAGVNRSPVPVALRAREHRSTSGIGDLAAVASYNVAYIPERQLSIDLGAGVKLPTGAEPRLGTGEMDYSFQADAVADRDQFTFFGTLGYNVLGEPSGYTLENSVFVKAGGSFKYMPRTVVGLTVEWRQAASPVSPSPLETTVYANHELSPGVELSGYVLKGWSDGSPELGLGISVLWRMNGNIKAVSPHNRIPGH